MIPDQIINQINSLPIVKVIESYMKLKDNAGTWEGCCPLHKEKTPSFKVFPKNNNFKCFGCGQQGSAVSFVMSLKSCTYPEAIKEIGARHGIDVPDHPITEKEKAVLDHQESLLVAVSFASHYFRESLKNPANIEVLNYALSRWNAEIIAKFELGFAPDSWNDFYDSAIAAGFKTEILLEASLISESKTRPGEYFSYFRNRLMFPIHNAHGKVVGFTGRALKDEKPKYFNSRATPLYDKSALCYGIAFAAGAIRQAAQAYLVEGNADVIRLHEIGIANTVAISSTSFTRDQLLSLKELCGSITIIPDTDPAGIKSLDRTAKMILSEGMACNVMILPHQDEKVDADSYFKIIEGFKTYEAQIAQDYIIYKTLEWSNLPKTATNIKRAIDDISDMIVKLDPEFHPLYIDQVSRLIKPKKAWTDRIGALTKEIPLVLKIDESSKIPSHVSLVDWEKYGFYAEKNCYFFSTARGIQRGCNFTLEPLFHIESVTDAKRIFRITNEFGITRVIDLAQKDLISLGRFKECIESLGNFLWEMADTELNKLKRYLYQETATAEEIKQLGWHPDGFYSWGNGIFNDAFTKIDTNGLVSHKDKNYWLPAFSAIYAGEKNLYVAERQFVHSDKNDISLHDYTQRLISVFGDNASIALCFYFSSLFRDQIVRRFHFFPILNLFGPKGAGKTELAVSIMSFFGKLGKGPNINNTSKAALADHVSQLSNACTHIDEYKNTVEFDKIEFLKGLWDGTGRTRMNMDKDKKKETTAVDCAVILSGQEMPTADIALYSRLIYLTFNTYEYDDNAKKRFNELKEIEGRGNTHITNQILGSRNTFKANFDASYEKVSRDMNAALQNEVIEDRIFRNWLIPLATFHAIREDIVVPFTYAQLVKLSCQQILIQNKEIKSSNEVSTFWDILVFLAADGVISDKVDFEIQKLGEIKTEEMKVARQFPRPTNVIFVQMSRIFQLYRKHGKMASEKILPLDSITYYLRADRRYIGMKTKRFRFIDTSMGPGGEWKTKSERAFCFLYDPLKIHLNTENSSEDSSIGTGDPSEDEKLESLF